MTVFIIIAIILIDRLYLGLFSYVTTKHVTNKGFDFEFRCAGSFVYNEQGRLKYFSGSYSKVGIRQNEIVLGLTKLSYHKKLSDIKDVEVKNYFLWKCLVAKLESGESVKILCDTKQIKKLGSYLDKFNS